jgi:protein-S-isoprenylcysteine O-methyltransferase Ste14
MEVTAKIVTFGVISLALAYVSRRPLRHPRCHGFPRFFAWEAIVGLILLNLDDWFDDPLSPRQIVSWVLLLLSAVLAVHGVAVLSRAGKPGPGRLEPGLIGVEKTTELVTAGAYRYVRHPMYCSLLLLAWGTFLKAPSWPGGGLAAAATLFLWWTARVEEGENLGYFGTAYQEYRRHTWMLGRSRAPCLSSGCFTTSLR